MLTKLVFVLLLINLFAQNDANQSHRRTNLRKINFSEHRMNKRAAGDLWNYEDQNVWNHLVDASCNGKQQSPINLIRSSAFIDRSLELSLNSYSKPILPEQGSVYSNGHTLKLEIKPGKLHSLSGTVVDNQIYELAQFHWHWGHTATNGSEHAIDGSRSAAEVHLVHRNGKYNSSDQALQNSDGLAVIGITAEIGPPNSVLAAMLDSFVITKPDTHNQLKQHIDLNDLFPANTRSFFKYSGSLTTPSCAESVTWIVMKNKITVSEDQLRQLRDLVDHNEKKLSSVVRNLQLVGDRKILQSDKGSQLTPFSLIFILTITLGFNLIQSSYFK